MTATYQGPDFLKPLMTRTGWQFFHRATSVALIGPKISDKHLDAISKLRSVSYVSLSGTECSSAAIDRFKQKRSDCELVQQ